MSAPEEPRRPRQRRERDHEQDATPSSANAAPHRRPPRQEAPVANVRSHFELGRGWTNFYFGYGSNLSRYQMNQRCPNSAYRGVGRLPKYQWFINKRGYANIIHTDNPRDEVYGLVYSLTQADEQHLDLCEGVGKFKNMTDEEAGFKKADRTKGDDVYSKEMLEIEFWPGTEEHPVNTADRSHRVTKSVEMLVYIDHNQTTRGPSFRPKYTERIRQGSFGIKNMGVPSRYVRRIIRPFIPAQDPKPHPQVHPNAQSEGLHPDSKGEVDPEGIPAAKPATEPENDPEINPDANTNPYANPWREGSPEKKHRRPVDAALHPKQHLHRSRAEEAGGTQDDRERDDDHLQTRPRRDHGRRSERPQGRRRESGRGERRDSGRGPGRQSQREDRIDGGRDRQEGRRRRHRPRTPSPSLFERFRDLFRS